MAKIESTTEQSLHHRRSDLRHLGRFAAAILLSARHLVELGLKVKK
jgi:hypothetical protein